MRVDLAGALHNARRMKRIALLLFAVGCTDVAPGDMTPGGGGKADEGGVPALACGAQRTGLAAYWGDSLEFRIDVPAGATSLSVATRGGSGDADLMLRQGLRVYGGGSQPYDFRSSSWGNDESIDVADPDFDRWYVMVSAATSFDNVSLIASCAAPAPLDESEPNDDFAGADTLAKPGRIRGRLTTSGDVDMFRIHASGQLHVQVTTPPGADFDLTVRDADEYDIATSDTGGTGDAEELTVELGDEAADYVIAVEPYLDNVSSQRYVLSADW